MARLGEFCPVGLFLLWAVVWKLLKYPKVLGNFFFHGKSYVSNFNKKWVGPHLWLSFHKLIWSPCLSICGPTNITLQDRDWGKLIKKSKLRFSSKWNMTVRHFLLSRKLWLHFVLFYVHRWREKKGKIFFWRMKHTDFKNVMYIHLDYKKIASFLKQKKMYLASVARLHYIRLRYRTSSVRIPPKLLGL
jgi:hypothetical protein